MIRFKQKLRHLLGDGSSHSTSRKLLSLRMNTSEEEKEENNLEEANEDIADYMYLVYKKERIKCD